MCGIVGVFSDKWDSTIQDGLSKGLDRLKNRGPDDVGLDIFDSKSGSLGLGHTRLSIIDLSEGGHQPMIDKDQRFAIVFNGEIYNYRELRQELIQYGQVFLTDSDTEVLLKAWIVWGENCISRLVGMFAFAVFDSQEDTLTLVRDAFGIKPLFYSNFTGRVCFASEIRAISCLTEDELAMDQQTAYSYLIHGAYDNSVSTFFENVSHLSPGHMARIKLDNTSEIKLTQWWKPSVKQRSNLSFKEAADELRDLFLKSVKLHLRSDVPLCINLSGGIDSSSIACAVRYLDKDMPINTVSFVSRGSAEDEEVWIDIVNKHIDAKAHKVVLSGGDLSRDIDDMMLAQGEPFVSSSVYAGYMVFKQVKNSGFVVSLDGQGADEMFAGYDGYPHGVVSSMVNNNNFLGVVRFLSAWSKWPGRSKFGALKYVSKNIHSHLLRNLLYFLVGRDLKPNWLSVEFIPDLDRVQVMTDQLFMDERAVSGRTLMGVLRAALTKSGLPGLLRHSDRNSMRWSVESRVPFLTTELAEFALGLPEEYLISHNGETKSIFREAMRGVVPDAILDRRDKIGFKTPELSWIMAESSAVRTWIEYSREIRMLDGEAFILEVESVLQGHKPYNAGVWRMISFCRWAMLHNLK